MIGKPYKVMPKWYSQGDIGNTQPISCDLTNIFIKDERSPTIDVKRTDLMEDLGCELGQRETLSDTDIKKINTMYKVNAKINSIFLIQTPERYYLYGNY